MPSQSRTAGRVDRRPVAQAGASGPDPWARVEVVLDLDATQAAQAFTEVVDAYAA